MSNKSQSMIYIQGGNIIRFNFEFNWLKWLVDQIWNAANSLEVGFWKSCQKVQKVKSQSLATTEDWSGSICCHNMCTAALPSTNGPLGTRTRTKSDDVGFRVKYGSGPTQQDKMAKYTGSTQDTQDYRVFNNWKKLCHLLCLGWDQCI